MMLLFFENSLLQCSELDKLQVAGLFGGFDEKPFSQLDSRISVRPLRPKSAGFAFLSGNAAQSIHFIAGLEWPSTVGWAVCNPQVPQNMPQRLTYFGFGPV
jgi:hypothetical protein